uniref:Zgc:113210 n=1 Tax=Neogobius melanostomus TaxID=47308 RepID=A0A8C6SIW7_9GOBI
MFPDYTLKPKPHYLLHYPGLILKFGPLIRLWTLRFESKHCNSRTARKLHNFIHLSKTLAERHQLLQSYLGQGHLFPPHIQIAGEANEIDVQSYNRDLQMVLKTSDVEKLKTSELSAVTYKGIKYTKGLVVSARLLSTASVQHLRLPYCLLTSLSMFFILGMEVTWIQEVMRVLPELGLDDETSVALIEHLSSEIGVKKKEDLALVDHEDLLQHLKPIQRRRFIQATTDERTRTTTTVRCKVDSYGCINWQPKCLPEGETSSSLEDRRKDMLAVFQSVGPRAGDRPDIDESMRLTYIYQRHMLNSCPPPSIEVTEEHWPFLFTKRGLCDHFKILTGIICDRIGEALQSKGMRIKNFFQRRSQNRDIQRLLRDIESNGTAMQQSQTGIATVLILMMHFLEKEDSIFLLADINATKLSVKAEMTLPATPRLILLGNTFLSATKWMVSFEGRVAYILEEHLGFADALSEFFGCFYVFNIEYQQPACATLELIQRFFVRINQGTKCSAKIGTSRKTGAEVKRKVETVNSRVSSFLCQLTEFEWKN